MNRKLRMCGILLCLGLTSLATPTIESQASPDSLELDDASDSELKAFGQKLLDIHARQAMDEYLALIHPNCPKPYPMAMEWTFARQWLPQEPHDIRINAVEDQFDMSQIAFLVTPTAAIEIQSWTLGAGGKRELVTGFPVAKYDGQMRVIDYPCFELK